MPPNPDAGQAPRASHAGASRFSDPAAARRAVELALPMLQASLRDKAVGESGCMHVVVMDPTLQPGDCAFEERGAGFRILPRTDLEPFGTRKR